MSKVTVERRLLVIEHIFSCQNILNMFKRFMQHFFAIFLIVNFGRSWAVESDIVCDYKDIQEYRDCAQRVANGLSKLSLGKNDDEVEKSLKKCFIKYDNKIA